MVIKTIILLLSYILPMLAILIFPLSSGLVVGLYAIMGVALAGIGMGIMHDANHGSYSRNQTLNDWLGYSLNLIGGMAYNWKLQHNVLHHTYTNIHGMDDDIANKLVLRFSPHSPPNKFHRWQFIYVFFFYGILTLYWCVAKDFIQYFKYIKEGVNRDSKKVQRSDLFKTIILKALYFFYILVLPLLLQPTYSFGLIFGSWLLMHAIGGLLLGLTFQLAHSVEEAEFPLPNASNVVENDWAMHQMATTVNFARNNKLVSWYVGGLNYQVEHHLFPNICHVHYPEITKIVEATAKEFGVPYRCAPTVGKAFRSHFRMLRKFGFDFNLDLATM